MYIFTCQLAYTETGYKLPVTMLGSLLANHCFAKPPRTLLHLSPFHALRRLVGEAKIPQESIYMHDREGWEGTRQKGRKEGSADKMNLRHGSGEEVKGFVRIMRTAFLCGRRLIKARGPSQQFPGVGSGGTNFAHS